MLLAAGRRDSGPLGLSFTMAQETAMGSLRTLSLRLILDCSPIRYVSHISGRHGVNAL